MGAFDWPLRVSALNGDSSLGVKATVDTGATYTVLPARVLRQLGVSPTRKLTFELADGRRQVMDVGQAWVTIDGTTEMTPVVFGGDATEALLGAVTLQIVGLAVDSVGEKLVPADTFRY